MKRVTGWIFVMAAVGAAPSSGCIALSEGVGAARGAKALYMQIRPDAATAAGRPLVRYTRFELGNFTDEIGGKVPPELMPYFRMEFKEQMEEHGLVSRASGKTLLIRGQILHYEGSGTMGVLLSAVEEVIVRTELVDKSSGKVLAVANCIGRSKTRVNRGVDKKAEGLAKSVAQWIAYLHHGE